MTPNSPNKPAREQQQFLDVIDRDEAERRFLAAVDCLPCGEETVPLDESLGRVLSRDVVSEWDVPSFVRSNFVGCAVRAEDTYGAQEELPRSLALLEEVLATAVVHKERLRPARRWRLLRVGCCHGVPTRW